MPFAFTNPSIQDGDDWTHDIWNQFVEDLRGLAIDISDVGSAPITLSRARQHLDGSGNYLYDFARWFGLGSNVSVREATGFNADPTGITQSGALINAAIDDLPTSGGIVFIPPGTYLLEEALVPAGSGGTLDYVAIIGAGYGTTLKLKDSTVSSAIDTTGCANVMIANLRIDGNLENQPGDILAPAIDFVDTTQSIVQNVWITNWSSVAIRFGQTSTTTQSMSTVFNCRITNCASDGIQFYVDRFGPTPNLKQSLIVGNLIERCQGNGITLKQCRGQAAITQNMMFRNTGNGIAVENTDGAEVRNRFSVTDNICAENSFNGISLGDDLNDMSDLVLKSNICCRNGRDGIRFTGTGEVFGVNVFGNILSDNGAYGLRG